VATLGANAVVAVALGGSLYIIRHYYFKLLGPIPTLERAAAGKVEP